MILTYNQRRQVKTRGILFFITSANVSRIEIGEIVFYA